LDFHEFRGAGAEFVFAGQHDAKGFCAVVGEDHRTAGDFALKIDVRFFDSGNILELRHFFSSFVDQWFDCT
jgi:hypothetical protein